MKPWRITADILIYPPDNTPGTVITFTTQKGIHMGEITVRADESTLRATISTLDNEGNPTVPDTEPTWEVSDDAVLTVTPDAGGMSAAFQVGAPGVCAVTVRTTETHDGEGEPTEIVGSGLVTVTVGDTVNVSVEFTTET